MLNKVTVMGRITKDIELRRTQSGKACANFSIACERDFSKDKETDFFDIVAWEKTAEFIEKYFSKGRMIVISGKLQTRSWQDKDGNKRKAVEVVAENVYFGDSKTEPQAAGYSPNGFTKPAEFVPVESEEDYEQLPF